MAMDFDATEEHGVYFSDVENAGEMNRLLKQARLTTEGLGGPFPHSLDPMTLHDVLDLACGPGEWVLRVAQDSLTFKRQVLISATL